jgi:hypothetical protein
VYHSTDPVRLEADLERLRLMVKDERLQVERFMGTRKLETPPLV